MRVTTTHNLPKSMYCTYPKYSLGQKRHYRFYRYGRECCTVFAERYEDACDIMMGTIFHEGEPVFSRQMAIGKVHSIEQTLTEYPILVLFSSGKYANFTESGINYKGDILKKIR